jgi:predicted O-methyltransferase YrrM
VSSLDIGQTQVHDQVVSAAVAASDEGPEEDRAAQHGSPLSVVRSAVRVGEVSVGALHGLMLGRAHGFPSLIDALARHRGELAAMHHAYATEVSAPNHAVSLPAAAMLAALIEVRSPRRVLDLGSGFSSYVVRAYAPLDCEVVSVDDSPAWLARTQAYLGQQGVADRGSLVDIEWLHGDDSSFDLVFNDMGHMPTRCRWLPEVVRHIAPGGVMLIDDYQKFRYRELVKAYARIEGAAVMSLRRWTRNDFGGYTALWTDGASRVWKRWR